MVLSPQEIKDNITGIGGKARNLWRLQKLGIRIPDWLVIPETVLLAQKPKQDGSSDLKVPAEVLKGIRDYFGENFEQYTYAVRSSASDEDGKEHSFAGQFESYLHVSAGDLEAKIIKVWQSVFSDRIRTYRAERDLPTHLGMAVIVQRMVNAEISGVAFGANPINGDLNSQHINAVYGLGEGLVSGKLNADSFSIKQGQVEEDLVTKTEKYIRNDHGDGIKVVPVALNEQERSSLSAAHIKDLLEILKKLEKSLGSAQDIEFAIESERLYLTQTRPITTLSNTGEYILWDNSNIIESYPGITTPLTFSFILKMYDRVYRQFVQLMGVRAQEVEQHAEVFANTLGLVRGRVYYNLLNWYKMLAMLPGYSINAENMERMMGVKERFELSEEYTMTKGMARWRLFSMGLKMLWIQWRLPSTRRKFLSHLNRVMSEYQETDFKTLDDQAIISRYRNFESSLLLEWKAPLINDFFAMIWFGLLEKQGKKYCPQEPNIHNDLLCGSQDIISVEPIHRSIALAKMVSENELARKTFLNDSPQTILEALRAGHFPEINTALQDYIQKFGDRCIGELKLESFSYSQRPDLFVKLIKTYVEQGITQGLGQNRLEDEIRQKAELSMSQALRAKPLAHWWYKLILRMTRDLVSNRENLRFERTRGFGMVRNMFNALGAYWERSGVLSLERDIYYLKLEEILASQQPDVASTFKAKVLERKAEFRAYQEQEIPMERFFTYGYDFRDEYIYATDKLEAAVGELQGIGCCPGKVKAQVRIVRDPNEIDSLQGDILVTTSTDPGWVTLFPTASAIMVERGSLLSHSAIVSREMGIPCIVGVNGLLRSLKDGDWVMMDGSTGAIKILDDGKATG